jgi:hypothetical protein
VQVSLVSTSYVPATRKAHVLPSSDREILWVSMSHGSSPRTLTQGPGQSFGAWAAWHREKCGRALFRRASDGKAHDGGRHTFARACGGGGSGGMASTASAPVRRHSHSRSSAARATGGRSAPRPSMPALYVGNWRQCVHVGGRVRGPEQAAGAARGVRRVGR